MSALAERRFWRLRRTRSHSTERPKIGVGKGNRSSESRLDEALARILSELPEEVETIQEMPLMLRLPRLVGPVICSGRTGNRPKRP